jgi:hypothetical protein
MKISSSISTARCRQGGSVVVILLFLLAIMLILTAANSSTLLHLHRELNLLEQRQTERLNPGQTNATGRSRLPPGLDTQDPRQIPAGAGGAPAKSQEAK